METISFREMELEDVPFFLDIRNECRDMLHDSGYYSLEEAFEWWPKKEGDYWVIRSGMFEIGYVRLSNLGTENVQVGMDIHVDFRNQGYGALAYYYLFIELLDRGHKKCSLRVLKGNDRAIYLYQKLGFITLDETETDFYMEKKL